MERKAEGRVTLLQATARQRWPAGHREQRRGVTEQTLPPALRWNQVCQPLDLTFPASGPENSFLLFTSPSGWCFVTAALAN